MFDLPLVPALLTLVLIAFLLWFALGTQANIGKGNEALKWLQQGLPLLGPRTTVRWLGSSAVQMNVIHPHAPYAEAEVVVVLEPRDLGWLWAWSRTRGRRDCLILRGRLRRAPRLEAEVGDPRGWTGEDRLKALDWERWKKTEWSDAQVTVAYSGSEEATELRSWWDSFARLGEAVWRLSIRRDNPHVELHLALPDIASRDSRRLFEAFIAFGRAVVREG